MIKKISTALLVGVFALGLAACGQQGSKDKQDTSATGQQTETMMDKAKGTASDAAHQVGQAATAAGEKLKAAGQKMMQMGPGQNDQNKQNQNQQQNQQTESSPTNQ